MTAEVRGHGRACVTLVHVGILESGACRQVEFWLGVKNSRSSGKGFAIPSDPNPVCRAASASLSQRAEKALLV